MCLTPIPAKVADGAGAFDSSVGMDGGVKDDFSEEAVEKFGRYEGFWVGSHAGSSCYGDVDACVRGKKLVRG